MLRLANDRQPGALHPEGEGLDHRTTLGRASSSGPTWRPRSLPCPTTYWTSRWKARLFEKCPGVSERGPMAVTDRPTRSMLDRYNIVSEEDLRLER
jgi:hypothetical protein